MKKVTREEVASILVKDKYFSKGNYWLKNLANASGSFGLDDRCSSFYMGVFSIDETRKSQRFLLVRFFIGKENAVFLHRLFCIDLFQLPDYLICVD